ncbi:MAG: hypothetical protein QOK43_347 [Acidimicrobiaceae bacterium]|nr:hypothetical protein [Acidimicrobiaceae bacterium]
MSSAELDGLLRQVDALCERRDWDALVALRDRCRAALQRGKQWWPAASYAEYRLALEAPGRWAAHVVAELGTGRFALGPLTEVAACTHTWEELAGPGPQLALAAHERVVRGEDLRGDSRVDDVLELPLALQPWEPTYPVAQYTASEAVFPTPPLPHLSGSADRVMPNRAIQDDDAVRGLIDLAHTWITASNGRAEAVAVDGDAMGAAAALGAPRLRMVEMSPADAMAWMAWVAASGGAHGRRRGMAAGRFDSWWVLSALGGILDLWPVPPDEVGEIASDLRWYAWDAGEPGTGWGLRMAVEDPLEHRAWAVLAVDAD